MGKSLQQQDRTVVPFKQDTVTTTHEFKYDNYRAINNLWTYTSVKHTEWYKPE